MVGFRLVVLQNQNRIHTLNCLINEQDLINNSDWGCSFIRLLRVVDFTAMPLPLFLYVRWDVEKGKKSKWILDSFIILSMIINQNFQFKEKDIDCAFLLTYCCVQVSNSCNSCKIQFIIFVLLALVCGLFCLNMYVL